MHWHLLYMLLFWILPLQSMQHEVALSGTVQSGLDKALIFGATIVLEGETMEVKSVRDGSFKFLTTRTGNYILNISFTGFVTKRIPIILSGASIALGTIVLETDLTLEKQDNLITLTDAEVLDDETNSSGLGLLQATRDIFLTRAAFDFGQAFFRVRGYDAKRGELMLNGISMNKLADGRPQWNNWGGLNDMLRNQEFSYGLEASAYSFGGVLGTTNINLNPLGLRSGFRISSSVSNRTYSGRLMATYNSGPKKNGFAYMVSASRRWAKEGYISGTLYDAYSFYGALTYRLSAKSRIDFTTLLASNRRGRSAALTDEVQTLLGNRYNPYWGKQDGEIRNSRERHISEPMVLLNYDYDGDKLDLKIGLAYQMGKRTRSRVGYYNAPNPDPTYYRYLPSFQINSPIGANFLGADIARKTLVNNPQWSWDKLYTANTNQNNLGKASYLLYNDVIQDTQLTANLNGTYTLNPNISFDFGTTHKNLNGDNYAQITDLLGADFHEDIDPFSDTRNNLDGEANRKVGQRFNYNYEMLASQTNAFLQGNLDTNRWKGFVAGKFSKVVYQRNGLFTNERFLENSFGQSTRLHFATLGIKSGLTYKISGRHWLSMHGASTAEAPVLQNAFINPRESNAVVPGVTAEKLSTLDLNYYIRMPKLTGRLSGFYTRFQNTTDVNFFFVDSGLGSDFVQEVLTDLDRLHTGLELGLEYQLSASVKLSAVAALGHYIYASNPLVTINFDTAADPDELIDASGSKELGAANIKGLKLAQGPQQAVALGVEYRDPKYWWVGMTTNYMANSYANIATIMRTDSFYQNPETGMNFRDATPENVNELLAQNPLPSVYLLNMVGGKSWLKNGVYVGVFASVNNLFNTTFKTGGYEQSRNGNYGQLRNDRLSGSPSFGTKYWYGFGRTFFLNLAVSF